MKKIELKGLARKFGLMGMDMLLIMAAYYISMLLRFQFLISRKNFVTMYSNMPWILLIYALVFLFGGLYDIMWQYAGMRDLGRLVLLVTVSNGLILVGNELVQGVLFRTVLCLGALLIIAFIGGVRFAWRLFKFTIFVEHPEKIKNAETPLLIVGAGSAGAWAVSLCKQKSSFGNPVVMVDDDLKKHNLRVQGVPVRGTISDIPELVRRYRIREIVIAIPTLRGERLREVVNLCNSTRVRVRILSDPQELDRQGKALHPGLRELNTSDFLSREEVTLNQKQISSYLTGKTVLVTGGGGSIGSELCRQIMNFGPQLLIIFDIYENCAYELEQELRRQFGAEANILTLIGSVRDKRRLDEMMTEYRPNVVFHAAAHKHVPLMEVSPAEAVKNNVFGTLNLLQSASEHGVERFVQLSTDKAVNPTNVMGCTKRVCEMLIQTFARQTAMKCMAVRFGNVLGSHGSVIPLFEAQIKKGGPVTITHPDIVRYFMTIPEAAQLVLQAAALAQTGSIYVLDMGKPVRIMDLARRLIRFYGYEPDVNMDIVVTGLRPGEKLYEELMLDEEQGEMQKTAHNKIFVAHPAELEETAFYAQLDGLRAAAHHNDDEVVEELKKLVPTYHPNRDMM